MHLKKLTKVGEFLCSHFNIEVEENMQHFRHITLYYFKKGKNTTEMSEKICAVCGEGAVTDRMCQKWFAKFCAGGFSLDDAPRLGGPLKLIVIKSRH